MICQLRKYLEEIYVDVTILFNDNPPEDLKIFLQNHGNIDYQGQRNLDVQRSYRRAPR